MKLCPSCQVEKNLTEFYHTASKPKGSSYCKKCLNKYQNDRWIETKKKAIEHMGGKCCHCGFDKHYSALHFHHVDPTSKEFQWNKLRVRSWDKILKELEKCILLCANCHAIEHYDNEK